MTKTSVGINVGIKFLGYADGTPPSEFPTRPRPGNWLAGYNVEALDGRGTAQWTGDPAKALRWASPGAAFMAWRTTSTTRPIRPDGKPNRPLTAFTVAVEPLPVSTSA